MGEIIKVVYDFKNEKKKIQTTFCKSQSFKRNKVFIELDVYEYMWHGSKAI